MPQEPTPDCDPLTGWLVEAWRTLQLRIRCAVNAYHTAMKYKGNPGERPREVAREQIRIFLETAEREMLQCLCE